MSNLILNEGYSLNKYYLHQGSKDSVRIGNKKFIDLSNCSGSLILGHNHSITKKAIRDYLKNNYTSTSYPNVNAVRFSKVIKRSFPNFKKIVFCTTGSEAVIKSLRICRAINKKKKIVSVVGSWHGSVNETLFSQNKKKMIMPISAGLKTSDAKNLIYIPYNDIKNSKKILDKNKDKINCLIIEPVLGGLPIENIKLYLKFLDNYCKKNNINFILDEIITGFRCKNLSIQNQFKLKPDLTLIGKVSGGGMPIGIIGISEKISSKIKSLKQRIFFGGTFSGNSLSTYIGYEVINFIKKNKIITALIKKSVFFQKEINAFLLREKLKAKVLRFDSILRIIFTNEKVGNRVQRDFLESKNINKIKKFRNFLFKKKILYPSNGIIFLSAATNKKNLNYIIKNINYGLKKYFQ